ncbi:hypothetical protein TWF506_011319 [Arthrobotrys conoides]|uniref:Clr5 domain-containing protein n=1 Tax=Arthrobotrys conoides TaxID=74498 RepID=A0AAN8N628_9PEZI
MTYDWEKHKETLRGLYQARKTYHEIREYMILNHDFKASINAYKEMLKKQWGWDKYHRGTISGRTIVKRKSRLKQQNLERENVKVSREPPDVPPPRLQEQRNKGEKNINPSSQLLQSTTDTQTAQGSSYSPIQSIDNPSEGTWPYFAGSLKWWEENFSYHHACASFEGSKTSYIGQPLTSPPHCCDCLNDFGPRRRFGYFKLSEKLRLLKNVSILSLLDTDHRRDYGKDMLRILDTVLGIIELYYGKPEFIDENHGCTSSSTELFLIKRVRNRARRMQQLIFERPTRNFLGIIRLGHLSLTLILPTVAFAFHREEYISLIQETASLVWNLLSTWGGRWASSLHFQALGAGVEGHENPGSLFDETPLLLYGSVASYWNQYIFLVLRTYLGICKNRRTGGLEECNPEGKTSRLLRPNFFGPTRSFKDLGAEILSGEVPFSWIRWLLEKEGSESDPIEQPGVDMIQPMSAFIENWPKSPPLEELQSAPLELITPVCGDYIFLNQAGIPTSAITKFAETTKRLAHSYQKIGDTHIALDIYNIFHQRLLSFSTDSYFYAIQTKDAGTILSSISMLLVKKDMRQEKVQFWGTHIQKFIIPHKPECRFENIIKKKFGITFQTILELFVQKNRSRMYHEDTNRLEKQLIRACKEYLREKS